MKKPLIIAEVKTKSPFGFESDKSWEELFEIANGIADIISIHTNPAWGGNFSLVKEASERTNTPILAKGLHSHDIFVDTAIQSGASYVLVVGRMPKIHLDKCLIEPNTFGELLDVPPDMKVVWNSRDLRTGALKSESFVQARCIFDGWMCQASNIRTVKDIHRGAQAVLVGEHLEEFAKSIKDTYGSVRNDSMQTSAR